MTDAVATENVVHIHSNVDKALLDKVKALHALATTHQLFNVGYFPTSVFNDVMQAKEFVATLHGQALTEALAHPDADKIAKLVEIKKQRGELKDGEGESKET